MSTLHNWFVREALIFSPRRWRSSSGHTGTTDGPAVEEVEAVSPGGKLGRGGESALGQDGRGGKEGLESDHFVCYWEERRKC